MRNVCGENAPMEVTDTSFRAVCLNRISMERTKAATGTVLKGGNTRRIAVTMEEGLFLDRSISAEVVSRLKASIKAAADKAGSAP